jgi:thioester reductase-like protein
MKTAKVKNLEIIPPKSESGLYTTDTFMPKMHQVCVAVGKRASGKSTAIINLIERMKFDYCIAVSPTMNSNKELMDRLKIEHTFEDVDDPNVIDKIKDIVKAEAEDLERYKDELKRYNKLMKDLKEGKYLDDDLLLQFFSDENHFQKPEHRWNGEKPRIACIFDDMLGFRYLFTPKKIKWIIYILKTCGKSKRWRCYWCFIIFYDTIF